MLKWKNTWLILENLIIGVWSKLKQINHRILKWKN